MSLLLPQTEATPNFGNSSGGSIESVDKMEGLKVRFKEYCLEILSSDDFPFSNSFFSSVLR
jgi:hypothetical protein